MATPTLAMEDAAMPDVDDDIQPMEGDEYEYAPTLVYSIF
jgi:hypothetical protein